MNINDITKKKHNHEFKLIEKEQIQKVFRCLKCSIKILKCDNDIFIFGLYAYKPESLFCDDIYNEKLIIEIIK